MAVKLPIFRVVIAGNVVKKQVDFRACLYLLGINQHASFRQGKLVFSLTPTRSTGEGAVKKAGGAHQFLGAKRSIGNKLKEPLFLQILSKLHQMVSLDVYFCGKCFINH